MSNVIIALALQNNYCSTEETKEKLKSAPLDENNFENQSIISSHGHLRSTDDKHSKHYTKFVTPSSRTMNSMQRTRIEDSVEKIL